MKELPKQVSESVRRRNPHLYQYATGIAPTGDEVTIITKLPKRIRQSTKPLMNKLEGRFFDSIAFQGKRLFPQSITFRLANGVRYTPDVFCFDWTVFNETRPTAWEVKGPWFTDDAKVKIKLFAAAYPEIRVLLVSEDKASGQFLFQIVYP